MARTVFISSLVPYTNMTKHADIQEFLHGQVDCWNAGDRKSFLHHYRRMSPNGLSIAYAGQPERDPWITLEGMWAQQNSSVRIEVVTAIINGNEAACHHRNCVLDGSRTIDTIELYRFDEGRLDIRYFVAR